MIDLARFIDEGVASQQKFAHAADEPGPLDPLTEKVRYEKIIEFIGHLQEEVIEARVYCKRRSWKKNEPGFFDSPELRYEFIAEVFDILLFVRAILAYAGISGEEFEKVAMSKMVYNIERPDHLTNAIKELHGDCASSKFRVLEEFPMEELTGKSFSDLYNLS